jgi:TonB family protein
MYAYGEVLLSFVLNSNGKLTLINIIDERSCNNEELRKIAKESIEKASPFDPFPPDLEFKELSFSVVFSFE